jgi:predicted RNA binding protein YcfA (HicA-like mRNA interferase family)
MTKAGYRRTVDSADERLYARGVVKVREVIKLVQDHGWYLVRTRGSHRHFKHPQKPGIVTIAGQPNVDIPRGTLNSIFKQAGLKA